MAGEWAEERFGNLVQFVSDKCQVKEVSVENYISTENMVPNFGGITLASGVPLAGSVTKFSVGDTLFSNIRTYFKKVWQAQFDGYCSNDVLVFRSANEEVLAQDYLHHICRWERFTELSVRTSKGAKMPRGDKGALADFKFLLPPINEQRAIAHILGTLDDKIELNRKQNETLEAMARALFKAWFVDFEPVRAKMEGRWQRGQSLPGLPAHLYDLFPDRLVESELGEIPEGWSMRPLGDFADLQGGKQLEKNRIVPNGEIPVFGGAGVMGYTETYNADGFVIAVGRVGAYCGQFFSHRGKAWINNNASLIRQKKEDFGEWLFLSLRHADIDAIKKGAAQPFVSNSDLSKLPLVWPGEKVVESFSLFIVPLLREQEDANRESKFLAQLRDTLLPKLISGELRVHDAERFLKERGL